MLALKSNKIQKNIIMGLDGDGACVSWRWNVDWDAGWECMNDGTCEPADPTLSIRAAYESESDCLNNCGRGRWQCKTVTRPNPPDPKYADAKFCLPTAVGGCATLKDCAAAALAGGTDCPKVDPPSKNAIRHMYAPNKCMELKGGDITNGNAVIIADCDGSTKQDWVFIQLQQSGIIQYKKEPTKCLDLAGGNFQNGGDLEIWDCQGGSDNQLFGFDANTGSIYLTANGGQFCVDLSGDDATSGNQLSIWECNGLHNQLWNMGQLDVVYFFTLQSNSGKCLDLDGGDTTDGTHLEIWDCNGLDNQRWVFALGSWRIQYAKDMTKCLELPEGDLTNGNLLELRTCNGFATQQWGLDQQTGAVFYKAAPYKCLDLWGADDTNGSPIGIWDCLDGDAAKGQLWNLTPEQHTSFGTLEVV